MKNVKKSLLLVFIIVILFQKKHASVSNNKYTILYSTTVRRSVSVGQRPTSATGPCVNHGRRRISRKSRTWRDRGGGAGEVKRKLSTGWKPAAINCTCVVLCSSHCLHKYKEIQIITSICNRVVINRTHYLSPPPPIRKL